MELVNKILTVTTYDWYKQNIDRQALLDRQALIVRHPKLV